MASIVTMRSLSRIIDIAGALVQCFPKRIVMFPILSAPAKDEAGPTLM